MRAYNDFSPLSVSQLSFERNDHTLFENIGFTLASGELLQVHGDNGVGKSTLLRILAGYILPARGAINWQGKSIFKSLRAYQERLHYLGHQAGLKQHLTVWENLQLHTVINAEKFNVSNAQAILAKLAIAHLRAQSVKSLSSGQLRRAALARVLCTERRLWLLDEPSTGLDAQGQHLLSAALQTHLTSGGMAIVATHQPLTLEAPIKTLQLGVAHA